jgi:hypothetical protein
MYYPTYPSSRPRHASAAKSNMRSILQRILLSARFGVAASGSAPSNAKLGIS